MGSIVLAALAMTISLVQISCTKEANAQTSTGNTNSQLNKLVFMKFFSSSTPEVWISNYDGTGQVKVNINLPTGVVFSDNLSVKMSPNGQKLFFEAGPPYQTGALTSISNDIYSCNTDGTSVTKIISKGTERSLVLNGAH